MSRMAELHQDITDMLACRWEVDAIARVLNIPEDWVRAVQVDLQERAMQVEMDDGSIEWL